MKIKLLFLCAFLSVSAVLYGQTNSSSSPLVGKWNGDRPTDGYVWEMRYQFEFKENGDYVYTVQQVSAKRAYWKISIVGTYQIQRSDSARWSAIVVLHPAAQSSPPPTEQDRLALVDDLGLPDNNDREFRIRRGALPAEFQLQLTDGDPADDIDRVWYMKGRE